MITTQGLHKIDTEHPEAAEHNMSTPYVVIRPLVEVVNIHPDGHPKTACQPWGQSMVIAYRPAEPGTADITLANARVPHTRATLRALRDALVFRGIHTVYGQQGEGHTLPGGVEVMPGIWKVNLLTVGTKSET
jgi:hypothetical protein